MTTWTIERAGPDSWERVRALRLRALADTPDAFGTTLAEDEARPLADWRRGLESPAAATFLAVADGRDAGLARGARYDGTGDAAGLFSMWVAPEFRGRGIGGALADAVIAWARDRGHPRLLLDVGDGNLPAIALYASRGFRPTGVTGSLPAPRERVLEHQRGLAL